MKAERRWYELLLPGLASLLVLATVTVHNAIAYEYVEDTSAGEGWRGVADANGDEDTGYCWCWATASVATEEDESDEEESVSAAWYSIDWTWDGPPGNAPGGTLSWSLSSDGYVDIEGETYVYDIGDEASSGASADCGGDLSSSGGSADGDIEAWGYCDDLAVGYCTASGSGSPEEDYSTTPDPPDDWADVGPGEYAITSSYDIDTDDEQGFSAGTTYLYVDGGVDCYAHAGSSSYGGGWVEASADADADADASISGSFSSN